MLDEIIEIIVPVVELAADVAEAVITDKAKKKDPQPCDTETEKMLQSQSEAFVTSSHLM